jgi:hypothetical protein
MGLTEPGSCLSSAACYLLSELKRYHASTSFFTVIKDYIVRAAGLSLFYLSHYPCQVPCPTWPTSQQESFLACWHCCPAAAAAALLPIYYCCLVLVAACAVLQC